MHAQNLMGGGSGPNLAFLDENFPTKKILQQFIDSQNFRRGGQLLSLDFATTPLSILTSVKLSANLSSCRSFANTV